MYDRAVAWMEDRQKAGRPPGLRKFRAEATALLGPSSLKPKVETR